MPRNADPLLEELRRWGHAQVNRYAFSRFDHSRHVLEHARDYAPGTVERAMRDLVGRDGGQRRRFMATQAGLACAGVRELPAWAVDPIRASNDADLPHDNPEVAVDMGIPEELRWIDRSLAAMSRQFLLRAIIVRTEFTVSASRSVKVAKACDAFVEEAAKRLGLPIPDKLEGGRPPLTTRQYRYELEKGIDWLRGLQRLAA